ncbi:MAG: hydrophobin-315 [Linnemannia gamsii]|nr:MAG: hydrophobin-315 [Linnemannia gamsii]
MQLKRLCSASFIVFAPVCFAIPLSQCNTGKAVCCNSVRQSTDAAVASMFGLLGMPPPTPSVLVGLGCSPITVIGVGSGVTCPAQPVCCKNVYFNGLIYSACVPINL